MSKNIYIFFLYIFVFSLPLSEGIKNISWFLYIISWIFGNFNKLRLVELIKKENININILFLLILISPLLVALFCKTNLEEWDGAWDVLRYGLIGFTICHTKYSYRQILNLFYLITISTFIGILHGHYSHLYNGLEFIELHSVGHVNHSSIYISIALTVVLSILLTINKINNLSILYSFIFILFLFTLLEMAARGSIIPLLFSIILILYLHNNRTKNILILSFSSTLIILFCYILDIEVINKFMNGGLSNRMKLFNSSCILLQSSPFWGVGLENSIFYFEHEKFLSVCELLNIKFDDNVYQTDHVHSHNFYMQSLVERGVIGTIPQIIFLFYWAKSLSSNFILIKNKLMFISWNVSLASFIMIFLGGIFNTTFHHENATLSLILFSINYTLFKSYPLKRNGHNT